MVGRRFCECDFVARKGANYIASGLRRFRDVLRHGISLIKNSKDNFQREREHHIMYSLPYVRCAEVCFDVDYTKQMRAKRFMYSGIVFKWFLDFFL